MKADIRKVIIGLKKENLNKLLFKLGSCGLVHFEPSSDNIKNIPHDFDDIEKTAGDILMRIRSLLSDLAVETAGNPLKLINKEPGYAVIFDRDTGNDINFLDEIKFSLEDLQNERQNYNSQIDELHNQFRDATEAAALLENVDSFLETGLSSFAFGTIKTSMEKPVLAAEEAIYIRTFGKYVMGITVIDKENELNNILGKYGFEDRKEVLKTVRSFHQLADHVKFKINTMTRELAEKEHVFNRKRRDIEKKLIELFSIYSDLNDSIGAQKDFLYTDDTAFINGWIDYKEKDKLAEVIIDVCGNSFYQHIYNKDEMAEITMGIPVKLKNNRFFRAFEMLVKNVGIPRNMETDPTPIAGAAYVIMFGVMFGDVGQGLTLALAGLVIKLISNKKGLKGFLPDSGTILMAGGISAAFFGLLYGSIFSNEHLIPALWFHPMEHMMDLFFATIMMGALFISIGIILNIINLYRHGDYGEALFGINGTVGLVVYSGSLFLFVRYIKADIFPGNIELLLIIAVPVLFFLFRNIITYLFLKREKIFPHGVFEYAVESLVEIIEMFSGFLGNSISFIRAGAFALSHAGLSIAVYTLAEIVSPRLSVASITVIIIGNLFIILLEGLVCGIQSMRLEYYEFFGKFFRGDGVEFKPFIFKNYYIKEAHNE